MIEIISNTEFRQTKGNHNMTLLKGKFGWEMWTTNPATRAWHGRLPGVRSFRTLEEVEQHYKSWRGIVALVNNLPVEA